MVESGWDKVGRWGQQFGFLLISGGAAGIAGIVFKNPAVVGEVYSGTMAALGGGITLFGLEVIPGIRMKGEQTN